MEQQLYLNKKKMKRYLFILVLITSCIKFPNIGIGYKLCYNSRGDIGIVNSDNSYLIYGHILEYKFDSMFIIVSERPRDSIPECNRSMTLTKCNEAFAKSMFTQYWIIDKRQKSVFIEQSKTFSNVYGPFNKAKFLNLFFKLHIPKRLELKDCY